MDCKELTTKLQLFRQGAQLLDLNITHYKMVEIEQIEKVFNMYSEAIDKFMWQHFTAAAVSLRLQDHDNWVKFLQLFGDQIKDENIDDDKELDQAIKKIFAPLPMIRSNAEQLTALAMFSDLNGLIRLHLSFSDVKVKDEAAYLDFTDKVQNSIERVLLKRLWS